MTSLIFNAIGDRVAVDLVHMGLPIPSEEAVRILMDFGFSFHELRIIEDMREQTSVVEYSSDARMRDAPQHADCSGIIKWSFARSGIGIPRRSIQQRDCMGQRIHDAQIRPYDLVFRTRPSNNYFRTDPNDEVGHVGLVTHARTVLHLSPQGLCEEALEDFMSAHTFRGVTRIIPRPLSTMVLGIPPDHDIESSDDVMWLILRQLPVRKLRSFSPPVF